MEYSQERYTSEGSRSEQT